MTRKLTRTYEKDTHMTIQRPIARRELNKKEFHADKRVDYYEWMRQKESDELLDYVNKQNAYSQARLEDSKELKKSIFHEIKSRVLETDMSVPSRINGYWYYSRMKEGQQYALHCRKKVVSEDDWNPPAIKADEVLEGEEVFFDSNRESEGHDFFSLGGLSVSKDGQWLLYGVDNRGDERYDFRIRNLTTGQNLSDVLPSIATAFFSPDAQWVFYIKYDEAWRPYAVYRHKIGTSHEEDTEIFVEKDERFWVGISLSSDDRYILIETNSKTTSEVRYLSTDNLDAGTTVFMPRKENVLYSVVFGNFDAYTESEEKIPVAFVHHNAHNPNFDIEVVDMRNASENYEFGKGVLIASGSPYGCEKGDKVEENASRKPISKPWYCDTNPRLLQGVSGLQIEGLSIYKYFLLLHYRANGLSRIAIMDKKEARASFEDHKAWNFESLRDKVAQYQSDKVAQYQSDKVALETDELYDVIDAGSSTYENPRVRYSLSSYIHPPRISEYDTISHANIFLKEMPVLGGFDSHDYHEERRWATSRDGQKIPVSLLWSKKVYGDEEPQNAPLFVYGYGSYSISEDQGFSVLRFSIIDRGVVYAIAHIRGGGEMGTAWYEQGRRLAKKHTFEDFIDVTHYLQSSGIGDVHRTVASGGSAGGLLMGAIANMSPKSFTAIAAHVPFVDALTSILDPSLPLTITEWEEWGDPLHDEEVYQYMKSYSPYDNVPSSKEEAEGYPRIFAMSSMNDTRVLYVEPLKWVTKLQDVGIDAMIKLEMEAGHAGGTGRYRQWDELSEYYAWVLDAMGIEK